MPRRFYQSIWEYPYISLHALKNSNTVDIDGTSSFVLHKHWPQAISVDVVDLTASNHPLHKRFWQMEQFVIADLGKMSILTFNT
jgi:hypothetical protein